MKLEHELGSGRAEMQPSAVRSRSLATETDTLLVDERPVPPEAPETATDAYADFADDDVRLDRSAAATAEPVTPGVGSAGYKRAFDLVIATVVMVVGAPVFVLIFLAVALTSRGPAIYSSPRVGREGRLFRCHKFRTMVVGAEQALQVVLSASPELALEFEREFKLRRDPRVTHLGRFLRRTSLDELPQFWNVIKGDMSIVGWRPMVPEELARYGEAWPVVRSQLPGITGLWQVSGRNDLSYAERIRLDVQYAREVTMRRDLGIVCRTATQMIHWSGNGAY